MQTCDLLIIGGGLAGNTLACALADLPIKIILVDNQPPQQTTRLELDTRSLALAYRSCQSLQQLQIMEMQHSTYATPIQRIHVSDRGLWGSVSFTAQEQGLPALGYIIPLPLLQKALQEKLNQLSNCQCWQPAKLERIIQCDSEQSIVEIAIGETITSIKTQLLIAADGVHSTVRQWCRIPVTEHDYEQAAIVTAVEVQKPIPNTAYECFTEQGPIALLPLSGQRYGLVWSLRPAESQNYQALTDSEFLHALQDAFGYRLGKFTRVGNRLIYPVKMQIAQQQTRPGIILLGNAARTLHPIAGQGYNLILRDILGLRHALVEAIEQRQPLGNASTLQRYLALRQEDQQRIIRFTDRLVRLFSNRIPPLVMGRNLGLLAFAALPSLKREWLRRMMRE